MLWTRQNVSILLQFSSSSLLLRFYPFILLYLNILLFSWIYVTFKKKKEKIITEYDLKSTGLFNVSVMEQKI